MSDTPAERAPLGRPESAATEVCLLPACFRGAKSAARARKKIGKGLEASGDGVLDEVVLKVDARHRTNIYDPRRVLAGALTAAVTWGVFGLLTGGVASGGVWAIIGAVCGGLFAYYAEHLLSKDELKRIGASLPGDSSAIAAFVRAGDPRRVLASAEPSEPAQASVAAVGADLSARVLAGVSMPAETSSAPLGDQTLQGRTESALTMLLMRYRGDRAAAQEVDRHQHDGHQDPMGVQTELIFEAPVWSEQDLTKDVAGDWAEPGSERLIVRFNPVTDGALLEV